MTSAGIGHPGSCRLCGSRLKKNGKTSAGKVRWRCGKCGSSSTKTRPDLARIRQFDSFIAWLTSTHTQNESASSARTFRRVHAWCWKVKPDIVLTGEVYDEVQLDGTYLDDGWCLLTAINGSGDVINWQWCNKESTDAYRALITPLPPPRVVVTDGGQGLAAALKECWPNTKVQRCLVHVQRNIRRYTTTKARTDAGKAMYKLGCTLTRVKTTDQAIAWLKALEDWHQQYGHLLTEKTYAGVGIVRPNDAKPDSEWWWTHDRLRKAYNLLSTLNKRGQLFTYLQPELIELNISSTTNRLEGGINSQIKRILRSHRGMPSAHQRRAADWYCYLHSPHPNPPSSCIKPEDWKPEKPTPIIKLNNRPGDWGTAIPDSVDDWEPGFYIRKGWGGRTA